MINWSYRVSAAIEDFRAARLRAALEEILARLTGQSAELLSYEDVRQKLRATGATPRGVRDIPLNGIVGSVGRYSDFTRSFLPKQNSDLERWTRVEVAASKSTELPAIEVYQVGDAYFVLDGNHRVSVARQKGLEYISAHVTEVHTRVPLSPDIQPDDLIIKAEAVAFLESTHLDYYCSAADLAVSIPGQYERLVNHIEVHRYLIEEQEGHEMSFEEAACRWYQEAYLPVVQVIREQGILRNFPGRTETDLFLWISQHRVAIRKELGLDLKPESAVTQLVEQFNPKPERVATRLGRKLLDLVTPAEFEAGPPPGQWRTEHIAARPETRLFADVLVAINGEEAGWQALDLALEVARREEAQVHGFHAEQLKVDPTSEHIQSVEAEFNRRCQAAGLAGKLAFEVGEVASKIRERSWWVDLIVLSLAYPPEPQLTARLASGFRTILHNCARPVLAVPGPASRLEHALLAYDGSPKADEALFVATYLAGQWNMSLVVVTVESERIGPETIGRAQSYLETHRVQATYTQERGPAAEAILRAAEEHASDLILMGSYGPHPLLEAVRDSTVNHVLRASRRPMLICR